MDPWGLFIGTMLIRCLYLCQKSRTCVAEVRTALGPVYSAIQK